VREKSERTLTSLKSAKIKKERRGQAGGMGSE